LDSSRVTIDPAMPSEPGKILYELSSGGHLDGFSKRNIFVRQDSIQVQARPQILGEFSGFRQTFRRVKGCANVTGFVERPERI
jgi:hypothetical protein